MLVVVIYNDGLLCDLIQARNIKKRIYSLFDIKSKKKVFPSSSSLSCGEKKKIYT